MRSFAVVSTIFVSGVLAAIPKIDPLEMLPPGIASGLAAKIQEEQPYTLNLMPPEESAPESAAAADALMEVEKIREHGIEGAAVAEKQRLLNAEISKIHAIVAAARHHSFLRSFYSSMAPTPDYTVVLHAPSESKADIDAATNALLKVEAAKLQSGASADAAAKRRLLAAELAKIRSIVAGSK